MELFLGEKPNMYIKLSSAHAALAAEMGLDEAKCIEILSNFIEKNHNSGELVSKMDKFKKDYETPADK